MLLHQKHFIDSKQYRMSVANKFHKAAEYVWNGDISPQGLRVEENTNLQSYATRLMDCISLIHVSDERPNPLSASTEENPLFLDWGREDHEISIMPRINLQLS